MSELGEEEESQDNQLVLPYYAEKIIGRLRKSRKLAIRNGK